MLLPRLESTGDPCPSGSGSCSTTSALTGSADPDAPAAYSDSDNPNYHNRGPQRYIGIVMVAIIALAIIGYWMVWMYKKKNRTLIEGDDRVLFAVTKPELPLSQSKSNRSWLCLGRRRAPPTTPPSLASSTPSSTDPEKIKFDLKELQLPAQSALRSPESPERTRKISEAEKTRRRVLEDSAPRGGKVVKEVSGGMVIYTTRRSREAGPRQPNTAPLSPTLSVPESALRPPRRSSRRIEAEERRGRRRSPVRGRSVDLNAEWHMEHVQGVRYEARTPPERQNTSR